MPSEPSHPPSARTMFLFAAACGLIVANIYYAQPLAGPIGAELGLSPKSVGLIVTLTQIGYGAGLLFVVPLGDLVENRRLILASVGLATLALVGCALSTGPALFLASALLVGLGSVAVQVLVPFAAHLTPLEMRGRAVGSVMTGLMLGIMGARPVSSFVAGVASWHAVYWISAATMVGLGLVLARLLPERRPVARLAYAELLASMGRLWRTTPVLRRRAFYQACLFAAFSLFWTAVPLHLAAAFGFGQHGIALFALAGVAGAVAAPIAGHLADRGFTRTATAFAMILVAGAFAATVFAASGARVGLALLVAAAILIDFGVQTNLVVGQRTLFVLGPEVRSRLNGLYMATFFVAGAAGSALGAWSHATGGWTLAAAIGTLLPLFGLAGLARESFAERRSDGRRNETPPPSPGS